MKLKLESNPGATVGRLDFVVPDRFEPRATATGFSLALPAKLTIEYAPGFPVIVAKTPPLLCGLEVQLRVPGSSWGGQDTLFGVAVETGFHVGPLAEHPITFVWRGSPQEVGFYEKVRNGRPPRIRLDLTGEHSTCGPTAPSSRGRPERITGSITIDYPTEVWAAMLRQASLGENVLVEAPLSTSPQGPEWKQVWDALVEARDSFERGGETAWGNAITATRKALEKWRAIEDTTMGPGWTNINGGELKKWTAKQRLDLLRFALLQFGHLSAHELGGQFKREHAQVALAGLASLLAERKP